MEISLRLTMVRQAVIRTDGQYRGQQAAGIKYCVLICSSALVIYPCGYMYSAKEVISEWEVASDRWCGARSQKA